MAGEILRVGAEFDVAPIVSGAQQAGTAIDQMAARLRASGLSAKDTESALVNLGIGQKEAAQAASAAVVPMTAATAAFQAQAIQIDADAAALVGWQTVVAGASLSEKELTAALVGNVAANELAASSAQHLRAETLEVRLATDIMTGNFGRAEQALIRLATQGAGLGAVLEIAFPAFAAIVFASVITQAAEKVYTLYQNVVLLKDSLDSLNKASATEAEKAAALNYEYERGLAQRLESQGKLTEAEAAYRAAALDKPLTLPAIDDKNYKQFSKDFVSFMQSVHTAADAPTVITRIAAEAESAQTQLDAAKKKLEDTVKLQKQLEDSGVTTETGGTGIDVEVAHESALVEDLTKKLGILKTAIGEVQSQTGIAANEELIRLTQIGKKEDEAAKRKTDEIVAMERWLAFQTQLEAKQEKIASDAATFAREQAGMFEAEEDKKAAKVVDVTSRRIAEEQRRAEQSISISESIAMADITAQQSAAEMDARLQQSRIEGSNELGVRKIQEIGNLQVEELERLKAFEQQKLAVEIAAKEAELKLAMAGKTPEDFFSGGATEEQLTAYANLHAELEAIKTKSASTIEGLNGRIAQSEQDTANKVRQSFIGIFASVNSSFSSMVQGILMGTQTASQAFARMGGNIVISTMNAIGQAGLKWAEHFLMVELLEKTSIGRRIAAAIAGHTIERGVEAAANTAKITGEAGVGAAAAFTSVLVALPFPANVAAAPGVAAAEFAQIMGFVAAGVAEKGAIVPRDMPIFAHAKEMILPAGISSGLQDMIAAGNGGGTGHTFNIGTINTASPEDFAKKLRTMVRRGELRI